MSKFVKIFMSLALAAMCAVALTACGVNINSIGLPTELALDKGETELLAVEYGAEDEATEEKIAEAAAKLTLEWTSSDESVATVGQDGLVTAVGAGECEIIATATSYDGKTVEAKTAVKVDVAPESLALEDATLTIGYSDTLTAAVTGENVTIGQEFSWTSSNTAIVTVDEVGGIKAEGIGTATVTVSNEVGQSATCTVTVKNIVCAYCGQEGHGSNNCEKKAADEAAAAEAARIAAEQAAQQAAAAQGGGGAGASGGAGGPVSNGDGTVGENHYTSTGRDNYTIQTSPDGHGSSQTGGMCP